MLVLLILLAVVLAPVWGARMASRRTALSMTAAGWVLAMAIVVGAAAANGTSADLDTGFWIFNSVLLCVALGLARVGERWRRPVAGRA